MKNFTDFPEKSMFSDTEGFNCQSDEEMIRQVTEAENFPRYFDEQVENLPPPRKRIWELDALRGFCIILMVFDHAFFMIAYFFGPMWFGSDFSGPTFLEWLVRASRFYQEHRAREIIHPIILLFFFGLCGISSSFSRSNLKRGLQLMVVALVISLVTYFFDGGSKFIHYGTITFLATCVLVWTLFYTLLSFDKKVQKYGMPIVSFMLFIVITVIFHVYMNDPLDGLPSELGWLFRSHTADGVRRASAFYSPGEHMSFFPWASFFFFGAAVGPVLYRKKKSLLPKLDRAWNKPLTFFGRHTLIIYVIHQIAIIGILLLVSYFWATPGDWLIF